MEFQDDNHRSVKTAGTAKANVAADDREALTPQQLIRENIHYLIAQLEAGHSESLTAFLNAMARFHHYSLGNLLLIARQCPQATHVAGIRTWNQLGRRVKRGEKGIAILAPILTRCRGIAEPTRVPEAAETPSRLLRGFRRVYVWDESQTEGAPLPTLGETTGDAGDALERLRGFVAARGIELEYRADIRPALGVSYGGRIALLPAQSQPEEFTALVHETAHELLHHGDQRPVATATVRETEAEAVAFVVSTAVGLNAETSVSYIQLYQGDAELLIESLEVVQQTSRLILAAITGEQGSTEFSSEAELAASREAALARRLPSTFSSLTSAICTTSTAGPPIYRRTR